MPRHNCPGDNGAQERVSGGQRCLGMNVRGDILLGGQPCLRHRAPQRVLHGLYIHVYIGVDCAPKLVAIV